MKYLDDNNVRSFIRDNEKCVVMFGASWCMPCKMLKPQMEKLNKENIAYIDVEETSLSATLEIRGVPTLICFADGKEVARAHKLNDQIQDFLEL